MFAPAVAATTAVQHIQHVTRLENPFALRPVIPRRAEDAYIESRNRCKHSCVQERGREREKYGGGGEEGVVIRRHVTAQLSLFPGRLTFECVSTQISMGRKTAVNMILSTFSRDLLWIAFERSCRCKCVCIMY